MTLVKQIRDETEKRLKAQFPKGNWEPRDFELLYLQVEDELRREGKLTQSYKDPKEVTKK